ncbi:MAG: hypothetical protein Athens101428_462 [Candidatus Berkelbacteria bacterium Athens1014_28]|uniref:Uncharacterized protein n=1 Tax=Candidatus Berkelbacteria bacterium Athens1014_28 TaxID=2017145 RepID=A0A554LMB9_9BACT|nr:MAG: hypothetical protein Athens101428_462 [Candidatus Berkelbacteria bacterium Athens1014_28]
MRKRVVGIMSYSAENDLFGIRFDENTNEWICVNTILGNLMCSIYCALLGKKVEMKYHLPGNVIIGRDGVAIELKVVPDEMPNCYETIE